jgi:hypothetical protein
MQNKLSLTFCGACMLFLDEYHSAANVFSMPTFVHAMLRENGSYLNTLLFGTEKMSSNNPIFAVILHTDPSDAWVSSSMKYQASICYDMRHLRLHSGSVEYEHLLDVFQSILQCKVTLLGFSSFERAVGLYTALFDIMLRKPAAEGNDYCGLFRRESSSMVDMHLYLVLQCFVRRQEHLTDAPCQCAVRQLWREFFDDAKHLHWYHDYVMLVVSASRREGCSLANVEAASQDLQRTETSTFTAEQLATTRAKQSLLKLLLKAHKYRVK